MAEAFVKETIEKNAVVVFSKTYCPFCSMAKEVLKEAGLQEVTDLTIVWLNSKIFYKQNVYVFLCVLLINMSHKYLIVQYCLLSWC